MKFKLGKLYKIVFYDHSAGLDHPVVCHCVGWAVKDEKDYVTVTSWVVDTKDDDLKKNNYEPHCILKKVIIKTRMYS